MSREIKVTFQGRPITVFGEDTFVAASHLARLFGDPQSQGRARGAADHEARDADESQQIREAKQREFVDGLRKKIEECVFALLLLNPRISYTGNVGKVVHEATRSHDEELCVQTIEFVDGVLRVVASRPIECLVIEGTVTAATLTPPCDPSNPCGCYGCATCNGAQAPSYGFFGGGPVGSTPPYGSPAVPSVAPCPFVNVYANPVDLWVQCAPSSAMRCITLPGGPSVGSVLNGHAVDTAMQHNGQGWSTPCLACDPAGAAAFRRDWNALVTGGGPVAVHACTCGSATCNKCRAQRGMGPAGVTPARGSAKPGGGGSPKTRAANAERGYRVLSYSAWLNREDGSREGDSFSTPDLATQRARRDAKASKETFLVMRDGVRWKLLKADGDEVVIG
jgi:hypothetical protein